jgi:hypothetical protein
MLYFTGDFLLDCFCRFSLRRQCVLDGTSAADLLVDVQQQLRQPTKAVRIAAHLVCAIINNVAKNS